MILPFLLHHANRCIKEFEQHQHNFYKIKDTILKKGEHIAYDIQHIPGKKCRACNGKGIYTGYHWSGDQWHDQCWHCWRGWFKMPVWICLDRIKFGKYTFHRPLKREQSVVNPFTTENMGWEVSKAPVIEGYITHDSTDLGFISLLILFFLYEREYFYVVKKDITRRLKWRIHWRFDAIKKKYHWRKLFPRPKVAMLPLDKENNIVPDEELPF
jgi:hypothetical protein